ncbi:MAG TPA: PfkB family carbohydrate kinase [Chloroflexota bacterium]|nr:PfkB family carbohydrate kinase [Chloroflexota bacterium]
MTASPDYLVVGNITVDYTPVGREWGGTALFAAITALRLNARVHVLTSMPEAEVRQVLPAAITVHNVDSPVFCTFLHQYVDGVRDQYITDVAKTLHASDLPPAWRTLPLVHFGPIAQEVGHDLLEAFNHALRGGSVQGWLRQWSERGHVEPLPPAKMLEWVPPVECSFLSEEDIGSNRQLIDIYRRAHKVVVLTDGAHGATVFEGDAASHVPAYPVREVDANGAGDVFSAAFMIRYYETGNALEAAHFATVVASYHVEHIGTEGLPSRAQVESRLQEYARILG